MTDAPDGGEGPSGDPPGGSGGSPGDGAHTGSSGRSSGGPSGGSSPTTEVHAGAWQETLSDLRALQESYEGKGWDTIATAAGDTGPVAPGQGTGDWGLVHVVPDSDAAAIADAVADATFPAYDVHRTAVAGRSFAVTSLLDPAVERAILLAHQFPLRDATDLVAHTRTVGVLHTVVRRLDGAVVARFEHDEPAKFFPDFEDFEDAGEGSTAQSEVDG